MNHKASLVVLFSSVFASVAFGASSSQIAVGNKARIASRPLGNVVKADGSGDFPTLQAALDAVSDGAEILAMPGVYKGPGNRDLDFHGKKIVLRSLGGYENTIIDCEATWDHPHRGAYFHSGETQESRLEGFTIQNGYAPDEHGGGILCENSSPTIRNNQIRNNSVQGISNDGFAGAGIAILGGSALIEGNQIRGNFTGWPGGGIAVYNGQSVIIRKNCIEGNGGGGGAGMFLYFSKVSVEENEILGNGSTGPGAGMSLLLAECTLQSNHFAGNSSSTGGGAIYADAWGIGTMPTKLYAYDNLFEGNSANSGGAVAIHFETTDAELQFERNTVSNNIALSDGGGLMLYVNSGSLVLRSNRFLDNFAGSDGAGAYFQSGFTTLENCLFARNRAQSLGGGAFTGQIGGRFVNCTFAENEAQSGGGIAQSNFASLPTQLVNCIVYSNVANVEPSIHLGFGTAAFTAQFCDIEGGFAGATNFDLDPRFEDPMLGDYTLASGSPCIDVADGDQAPVFDLDGNPRVDNPFALNQGIGVPNFADLGCYERQAD